MPLAREPDGPTALRAMLSRSFAEVTSSVIWPPFVELCVPELFRHPLALSNEITAPAKDDLGLTYSDKTEIQWGMTWLRCTLDYSATNLDMNAVAIELWQRAKSLSHTVIHMLLRLKPKMKV